LLQEQLLHPASEQVLLFPVTVFSAKPASSASEQLHHLQGTSVAAVKV
jgi:hypothetical protein